MSSAPDHLVQVGAAKGQASIGSMALGRNTFCVFAPFGQESEVCRKSRIYLPNPPTQRFGAALWMFDYAIYLEENGPFKTGIGGLDKQTWLIFYKCGYCDSSCQKFNEKM